MSPETKKCQHCKKEFHIAPEEEDFFSTIDMPLPKMCPHCRYIRRLQWRNFRTLYERQSDLSGKPMISMYAPHNGFTVYSSQEWWSDAWDPCDFGQEYDSARSFFEQYHELNKRVPKEGLIQINCENSGYCNLTIKSKNCYLVFGCMENENCYFGHIVWNSTDCVDCFYVINCELCYWCNDCVHGYHNFFSNDCNHCTDVYFCSDCFNCQNCFGCVGLKNKQYYWFNEPMTKEQFEKNMVAVFPLTDKKINQYQKQQFALRLKTIFPPYHGKQNENVSGDHVDNCKNCEQCFDIKKSENTKYCATVTEKINCYDINFSPTPGEHSYNNLAPLNFHNVFCSHMLNNCHDMWYCDACYSSSECLGCTGLRNKKYCILNKQYEKAEYEQVKAEIIKNMKLTGEWGEFWPEQYSPFCYNESVAQDYHPLSKEEAKIKGYRFKETDRKEYKKATYEILADSAEIPNTILEELLACGKCGKNYKIIPQELAFYKKHQLPAPRFCPNCRQNMRMQLRNARELKKRQCSCQNSEHGHSGQCSAEFATAHPLQLENVYCWECYQKEVY